MGSGTWCCVFRVGILERIRIYPRVQGNILASEFSVTIKLIRSSMLNCLYCIHRLSYGVAFDY